MAARRWLEPGILRRFALRELRLPSLAETAPMKWRAGESFGQ